MIHETKDMKHKVEEFIDFLAHSSVCEGELSRAPITDSALTRERGRIISDWTINYSSQPVHRLLQMHMWFIYACFWH